MISRARTYCTPYRTKELQGCDSRDISIVMMEIDDDGDVRHSHINLMQQLR